MRTLSACLAAIVFASFALALRARAATNDYAEVHAIFVKSCLECHASDEPENNLVLETFETLMKGGENGPSIVPGKSSDSLLVKLVQGFEVDGKKKIMPPGKREKLKPEEIALIRGWIDAGAKPPVQQLVKELTVPKIEPKTPPLSRECMPTSTFSRAVMFWNRRMFWKVRPMPRSVIACGGMPVTSSPSNTIRPAVGL